MQNTNGIYLYASERVFRLDAEAHANGLLRGDYSYYYNGAWHKLVNPEWCKLLDRDYDPHRVTSARKHVNLDDWMRYMSNDAEWLGNETGEKADEPLNAPAALITAASTLREHGCIREAGYLASLVLLPDLYTSTWMRVARTKATEEEAISIAAKVAK